ncbi:MAG: hypothetical protein F7O42_09250 [Opitutae bacterium]|nr:hypothetical protein [Opitutae bacterium]
MKAIIQNILISFISIAPLCLHLEAANRVALKTQASKEFIKGKAEDPTRKIQTYQFMKGNFHMGFTRDPSMKEVTFEGILYDLAMNLRKQGFYMHRDRSEGDLLIVVHSGVTDVEISYEEFMGYTSEEDMGLTDEILNAGAGGEAIDFATIDAMNQLNFNLSSSGTTGSANRQSQAYKAQLLGLERAYSDKISNQEAYDLRSMLDEERYFIVLMAYDYPAFKKGEAKLMWSTRYSIRTLGQTFAEAIKDMNVVASDYFGKNLAGITQKRATDDSRVEMGEIEVLAIDQDEKEEN